MPTQQKQSTTSERMPVLFLGHGNPMNAISENHFVQGFRALSKTIPKPTAIVCISAHWFTKGTKVTAMDVPRTIHDFGGFPKALFDFHYPAKGNPPLAQELKDSLTPVEVELNQNWGLDHGAWSVLTHLYPHADIPVIQLSIDNTGSTHYHFELAKRLQYLRNTGILIVCSGNIIHNLDLIDFDNFETADYGYDWAVEAQQTINTLLLNGNFEPLIEYEKISKAVRLAVPTPEHYLPLIYALGLKQQDESISIFNDSLVAGSLSMTSLKIG